MPFVQAKCPVCGGMLSVENNKKAAICQYCGDAFIVEEAINNYITNNITNHTYGEGSVVNVYGNQSIISSLIKRAYMFLEEGNFEKAHDYAEKVLDSEPENSEAYYINWLVDLRKRSATDLLQGIEGQPLDSRIFDNINFSRCLKFSDAEFREKLMRITETVELNFDAEIKKNQAELISLHIENPDKIYNLMWNGNINQPLTDETRNAGLNKAETRKEKYAINTAKVIVVENADFSWFMNALWLFEDLVKKNIPFILCANSCDDELLLTLVVNCMRNRMHGIIIVVGENSALFQSLNEIIPAPGGLETKVFVDCEKVFIEQQKRM